MFTHEVTSRKASQIRRTSWPHSTPKDIHFRPCAIVFRCRVEGLHNCVTVRGQKFLYSSTINKTFVQIEESKGEESIFHTRIIPVKGGTNSFHQLMRKCNSQMITFSVLIISPFFLNFFHSIRLTLGKTFIFSYRPPLCVCGRQLITFGTLFYADKSISSASTRTTTGNRELWTRTGGVNKRLNFIIIRFYSFFWCFVWPCGLVIVCGRDCRGG